MRATVVIPARNRPHDVVRAVRSLGTQVSGPRGIEVIVVDDGSDPPLAGALGDLADVRIVRLDPGRGRGAARNAGVEAARGDVILFMDSDMTAHPGLVETHLAAQEGDPAACVGHILWAGGTPLHRYLEGRGVKKLADGEAVPWRYFDSGNASVRRVDLLGVGGFSEEIPTWGGEDTLVGFALQGAGVRLAYLPDAVTCHHSRIDVGELCRTRYTFGRESLPVMIAARPEIAGGLRVDRLGIAGTSGGARSMKALLLRLLLRVPGRRVVSALVRAIPGRAAALGFDYLVYASILGGYRDSLRGARDPGPLPAAGPSAGRDSEA